MVRGEGRTTAGKKKKGKKKTKGAGAAAKAPPPAPPSTEVAADGESPAGNRPTDVYHEYTFRDPKAVARGYMYDMTQYCKDNVEKYLRALNLPASSLRRVGTPFID